MGFTLFNPIVNLIYFVGAIYFIAVFTHPLYIVMAYASLIVYYLVINGKKALRFLLFLFAVQLFYIFLYASYRHFGVTVLWKNSIGNNITMEALWYGVMRSMKGFSLTLCFLCMVRIISGDGMIYILGRICPKLSLFPAVFFRNIRRLKERWRDINTGRQGTCLGIKQGRWYNRMPKFFNTCLTVIGITLEDFIECSVGMKSRGYTLKGRTAYSMYSFELKDRLLLLGIVFFIVAGQVASSLGYAHALWNPRIIFPVYDNMAWSLVLLYGIYLIIPITVPLVLRKKLYG